MELLSNRLRLLSFGFLLLFASQAQASCGLGVSISGGRCQDIITSGTSVTLPSDWNISSNTIEAIGEGGNVSQNCTTGAGCAGAGGGAYCIISALGDAAGTVEAYQIGTGGQGKTTQFKNSSTLVADYGRSGSSNTAGAGGLASNSTGTTCYNGGAGATSNGTGYGGGGGGGAAGPNGAGIAGTAATNIANNGGPGGAGDNGSGGAGGPAGSSPANSGGAGTEYQSAYGAGGGGGGGLRGSNGRGGLGGAYGAGAGGATGQPFNGGLGAGGLIVITYTPAVATHNNSMLSIMQ